MSSAPPPVRTGRRAAKRAAQEAARDANRARARQKLVKFGLPAIGVVVVLLLVAGAVHILGGGGSSSGASSTPDRTQKTLLVQLVPAVGRATVADALLANDSADGSAVVLPVPGRLITQTGGDKTTFDQTSVTADGPAAAAALGDQLGVTVDGSWVLTGPTLAALVDKVGGVTVDVDTDIPGAGANGAQVVAISKGPKQKLDGEKAVRFASYLASGEPEQARLARFTAVWREVLRGLPDDVDATRSLVTSSAGSVSSLPPEQLAAYLVAMHRAVMSDSVAYPTLPTVVIDAAGATRYRLDAAKAATLVKQQFAGSIPPTPAGGPISVLVQNGVGTPGLSDKARTRLVKAGLDFQAGGNATHFGYQQSVILIPDASSTSRARGAAVANALGLPQADVRIASAPQSVADVYVILGADFRG